VSAVLGVDPGNVKAGYAVVGPTGAVILQGIVPVASLPERLGPLAAEHGVRVIALGRGTNATATAAALAALNLPLELVDEYETTRRARELYFADHPPRGWRRLVPLGLQVPARPVDDYAAILIARRFLERAPG
jgi:RNase H-fold protein (predicted Holliday junction resolvase)